MHPPQLENEINKISHQWFDELKCDLPQTKLLEGQSGPIYEIQNVVWILNGQISMNYFNSNPDHFALMAL